MRDGDEERCSPTDIIVTFDPKESAAQESEFLNTTRIAHVQSIHVHGRTDKDTLESVYGLGKE